MNMFTSNYATYAYYKLSGGISVSQWPPKWWEGPWLRELAPSKNLMSKYLKKEVSWDQYKDIYNNQLSKLDPISIHKKIESLTPGHVPILLCFESAKTLDKNPCHRRLIARWLAEEINIEVPEWRKSYLKKV